MEDDGVLSQIYIDKDSLKGYTEGTDVVENKLQKDKP